MAMSPGPSSDPIAVGKQLSSRSQVSVEGTLRGIVERMLGPLAILVLGLLVAFPLGALFYGSFIVGSLTRGDTTLSLANYLKLIRDTSYLQGLWVSFEIFLVVTSCATALGVGLAWLLCRTNAPGRTFLEGAVMVQLVLSPFVSALAWSALASPRAGLLNLLLGESYVNVYSKWGVYLVMILYFTPYVYMLVAAALRAMDPALEEASLMAGAGTLRTARRVTLPLIAPAIGSAALLVGVNSFEMFSIPSVLGRPIGYLNLPYYIYRAVNISPPDWGLAAAMGVVLLLLTFIGVVFMRRLSSKSERFVTISGRDYKPREIDIGLLRYVGTFLASVYVLVAIVLPYGALVLMSFLEYSYIQHWPFSLRQYELIFNSPLFLLGVRNTLVLMLAVPTSVLLIGFVISFLVARTNIRGKHIIEYLGTAPVAIPGIVFGIALLWAYFKVPLPIYGTIAILLIGYAARFLPHAQRAFGGTLVQINRELEEAGRMCGASTLQVIRDVYYPLLRPGMIYIWFLVLLLVAREYSTAIMVFGRNTPTVPALMWATLEGGNTNRAYAMAVILTLIVVLSLIVSRYAFGVSLIRREASSK